MNKSILILDENSVIHGLVASALDVEGLTVHHEFNPGKYVERANSLMPDLILIGNSEEDPDYEICRSIKSESSLSGVPMVLLAGSKENLTHDQLHQIPVEGVVRKPFEASDLQQQVSKHLNLVEMIGSAYEYAQSQSMREEAVNPLANLDVVDKEVLGMLREGAGPTAPADMAPPQADAAGQTGAVPVVDDHVLAETLQPERAFETVGNGGEGDADAKGQPPYDSLETLEGEFPSESTQVPQDESELDELGPADVLEEDAPEETVFAPQGFDQALDASPDEDSADPELDRIEVEIPDESLDTSASDEELSEGDLDLFESKLDSEGAEADAGQASEENVPLSVRRMMELKPVFTRSQEEAGAQQGEGAPELGESGAFEPAESEVEAIQSELESLDEDDLEADAEEVQEQELEFVKAEEVEAISEELETPEDFDLDAAPEATEIAAQPVADAPEPSEAEGEEIIELDSDELEIVEMGEEAAADSEADISDTGGAPTMDELAAQPGASSADEETPAIVTAGTGGTAEAVSPESVDSEAEDDYFREEYLGDEEINEEQIIAAEEPEVQPELSPEDEEELDELLAEEDDLAELGEVLSSEEDLAADIDDDEQIELDEEEEEVILASLEQERSEAGTDEGLGEQAPAAARPAGKQDEPLFERNLKALEEEGAAAAAEEERWELEESGSGYSLAGSEEEGVSPGEPIGDEAASLAQAPTATEEQPSTDREGEEVSIEFGGEEGKPDVFGSADEEEIWKPDAPPGFVSKPVEEFPEDAVKDPVEGPETAPDESEPTPVPRHKPGEVLEDPDSLAPILGGEDTPIQKEPTLDTEPADISEQMLDEELGGDAMPGEGASSEQDAGIADAFEHLVPEHPTEAGPEVIAGEDAPAVASLTDAETEALLAGDADEQAAMAEVPTGDLEAVLGEVPPDAEVAQDEMPGEDDGPKDAAFDNLFASLQEEIAANPEGERLDDVLRNERIEDLVNGLEFTLPQRENTFARAMGIYAVVEDGEAVSDYPAALRGGGDGEPQPAATAGPEIAAARSETAAAQAAGPHAATGVDALSLLDADIRAKLGQVLDEIISMSVRKAVKEEMPKLVERLSREK